MQGDYARAELIIFFDRLRHILVHPVVMWWESGAALPAIIVQAHGWVSVTEFLFRSLLASNPSQFNLNVCM